MSDKKLTPKHTKPS